MSNIPVAFFVSAHGFGHAARAIAIMEALQKKYPEIFFHIYTEVPQWFFSHTPFSFSYHPLVADVGIVQKTSLEEDLPQTVRRLENFFSLLPQRVQELSRELKDKNIHFVLCDIAPLGLKVAQSAGIPGVLLENFTWPWLYSGFLNQEPGFAPFLPLMEDLFSTRKYHIQYRPFCKAAPTADLVTLPVAREIRTSGEKVRSLLGIPPSKKMVLLSLSGNLVDFPFLSELEKYSGIYFVIPGGNPGRKEEERKKNLILLPQNSPYYHPDLTFASDLVVGKLGHSTLAECFQAGVPFAFISREQSIETKSMRDFVLSEMEGMEILPREFYLGAWIPQMERLLSLPRRKQEKRGVDAIVSFLEKNLVSGAK